MTPNLPPPRPPSWPPATGTPAPTSSSSPPPPTWTPAWPPPWHPRPSAPTCSPTRATTRPPAAPGDVTWTLTQLINDPRFADGGPRTVVASVFDKDAVAACFAAGLGSAIEVSAGALVDHVHSGPAMLKGTVLQLTEGDATSGRVAVVKVGSIEAIITERRKPYHQISDFAAAGLDGHRRGHRRGQDRLPGARALRAGADWMLMLTPGGVDQDLIRLGHKNIERPMFPFDTDMDSAGPHRHRVPGSSRGSLGHGKAGDRRPGRGRRADRPGKRGRPRRAVHGAGHRRTDPVARRPSSRWSPWESASTC